MKNKISKGLISIFTLSLMLALLVPIVHINWAEAQNGPPVGGAPIDVSGVGKNNIKSEPSSVDIPLHKAELQGINDQLIQNPSEAVRAELVGQKEQIIKDVERWFADNLDPLKEEKAREK